MSIYEKINNNNNVISHTENRLTKLSENNQDLTLGLNLINDVSIFDQKYFYEMSFFLYSNDYTNARSRMKYAYRVLDMKKDLISNDITGKFSNELKTIFERNLHLNRFMRKMSKFRPLNKFGITRRKVKDIAIRQAELHYFSGKNTPFRILLLNVNRHKFFYTERSIYTIIPVYAKNLFYNIFPIAKKYFFKYQTYIMRSRNRRTLKIYFSGFKFYAKNKRYLRRYSKIKPRPFFFLGKRRRRIFKFKRLKFFVRNKLLSQIFKIKVNKYLYIRRKKIKHKVIKHFKKVKITNKNNTVVKKILSKTMKIFVRKKRKS